MPKFGVHLSRLLSATIDIEADNEKQAIEKVQEQINFGDMSKVEWDPVRKSIEIDDVEEY